MEEYAKRLGRYCTFRVTQVPDFPDDCNAVAREGALILPKLQGVCVPLCIEGRQLSSEEFAEWIGGEMLAGTSRLTFIIGGSGGLDERVKARGKLKLSFSKMTLPHQLMRVVLAEQLYRAFKILNHEQYHK